MTLNEIYRLFVAEGMKTDVRSLNQLNASLHQLKKQYGQLKGLKKELFDKETLNNPYADTRILYGNPQSTVNRMLVGIDIEVGEILLADRLRSLGQAVDLVLAHHPEGIALAGLNEIMPMQTDQLKALGFHSKVADELMQKRIQEVSRRLHGANHSRAVDAAKLLDVSLLCCHTPADNHVSLYLQKLFDQRHPKTLQSVIDLLLREPEYQDAFFHKAGPQIIVGKPTDTAGKIFVDMTGGTEGSQEIFGRLSQLGVKTYIGMHLSEDHFKRIKDEFINVVIAGHIASDNLGMNLLLDKLEKKAPIEMIEASGFRRVKRL